MFKDIYIINAYALAERLNTNTISDKQILKNVIIFIVLFTYGYTLPIEIDIQQLDEENNEYISGLYWLVTGIINFFGIILLFKENESGDGTDFYKRFLALSLPVNILVAIIIIISMILVGILVYLFESTINNLTDIHMNIIMLSFLIIYMLAFYALMKKYIKVAARKA